MQLYSPSAQRYESSKNPLAKTLPFPHQPWRDRGVVTTSTPWLGWVWGSDGYLTTRPWEDWYGVCYVRAEGKSTVLFVYVRRRWVCVCVWVCGCVYSPRLHTLRCHCAILMCSSGEKKRFGRFAQRCTGTNVQTELKHVIPGDNQELTALFTDAMFIYRRYQKLNSNKSHHTAKRLVLQPHYTHFQLLLHFNHLWTQTKSQQTWHQLLWARYSQCPPLRSAFSRALREAGTVELFATQQCWTWQNAWRTPGWNQHTFICPLTPPLRPAPTPPALRPALSPPALRPATHTHTPPGSLPSGLLISLMNISWFMAVATHCRTDTWGMAIIFWC